MRKKRDFFTAVVISGLTLTGCSKQEVSEDATSTTDSGGDSEVVDARLDAEDEVGDAEVDTADANTDEMVLIL